MGGKSYLLRVTQHLVMALIAALGLCNFAAAQEPAYKIEPPQAWVAPVSSFEPLTSKQLTKAASGHGYHDRLSDLQINATISGNTRVYRAVEYLLTNRAGVDNFSTIEILFNPTFQTLSLHELTIKRDDGLIDRLDTTVFTAVQSESDSARQIYNPTQVLTTALADVRVGDTIRYSYTLTGDNPVLDGHREFSVSTELWTQLDRQHVRILSASNDPLSRRVRGANVSLAVKDKQGVQEIVLDQRSVAEFKTENGVPSWQQGQGIVVFSDMDSWQEVASWATPLYQLPSTTNGQVVLVADAIRQLHATRDQRIGAAIRWVQEEIRYYKVVLDINARPPSAPETTLLRRFGDAKDKALLTTAILRELGVESHAALVNTQRGLEAGDYPSRLHAFNHVLVHIEQAGNSHFVDPTRRGQSGVLGEMYEPNYGRALILKVDTVDLVTMNDARSGLRQTVRKELTLPGNESTLVRTSMGASAEHSQRMAGLTVTSYKQGLLAEQVRYSRASDGQQYLDKTYLDYYKVLFPSIATTGSVMGSDNADNNATFVESYTIDDFWNFNEKVGEYRWLYADEIITYLDLPDKTENRKNPYGLNHPVSITETWVVPVSPSVRMHLEEAVVENEWLSFSKSSVIDKEKAQATITFSYTTLTNEVAAADLDRYALAVDEVTGQASFYLQHEPELAAAVQGTSIPWNTGKIKFWVVFLAMIYFSGWSLHFLRKYRKTVDYYSDEKYEAN